MVVFSEDELHQARATPVLEIAKEHGAKLKRSGKQHEGPCPVCRDGDDRFWVVPSLNVAGCRGCDFRGDAIALEMHLSGSSFVDAVRALIGAGRRNANATPTDGRGDCCAAGEGSRTKAGRGRRAATQGNERGADRRSIAADRGHARRDLSARRSQNRCEPLGDQARRWRMSRRSAGASASISISPTRRSRSTNSTANGSAPSSGS